MRPDDIVFLHDPQTAGMVAPLRETGAVVVWRCHVGLDLPNAIARGAWDFLRPYVADADAYVFSRRAFVWEHLDETASGWCAPSIDAFSPKNQELDPEAVRAILQRIGLGDGRRHRRAELRPPGRDRRAGRPARARSIRTGRSRRRRP